MKRIAKALMAGAAMLVIANSASAQDTVTLKIADSFPPSHPISVQGLKFWMDKVTAATGGKVQFQYFPAQQLGKANEMLRLIQSGIVEIALIGSGYISDKLPLSEVAALPGLFSESCVGTHAYHNMASTGLLAEKELKPNGVKVLLTATLPAYQIFTSTKPLNSLDDIRGLKIRSGGGGNDLVIEALGAVPVRVAAPEIMEVMQRGTVDGNMGPYTSQTTYGFADHEKFATNGAPLGSFTTSYMISQAVWDKLDPSIQEAMDKASLETNDHLCNALQADEERSIELMEKDGVKLLRMDEASTKKIDELSKTVQQQWVDGLAKRGLPAADVMSEFSAELKKASSGG